MLLEEIVDAECSVAGNPVSRDPRIFMLPQSIIGANGRGSHRECHRPLRALYFPAEGRAIPISFISICKSSQASFLAAGILSRYDG